MQVADCYIHVRYQRLSRDEFDELSKRLLDEARNLAAIVRRGRDMDYTFEEGTLFQRIVLVGSLGLSTLTLMSQYHNLRLSVQEMVQDGEAFSNYAIGRFHKLTDTAADQEIYKRTTSRDMNRLRRIVSNFDAISEGHVPQRELSTVRRGVIHDLAGLARANPDDPEVAEIMDHLPTDQIPNLPVTPDEAIWLDDRAPKLREFEIEERDFATRPRRRFWPGRRRRFKTRIRLGG